MTWWPKMFLVIQQLFARKSLSIFRTSPMLLIFFVKLLFFIKAVSTRIIAIKHIMTSDLFFPRRRMFGLWVGTLITLNILDTPWTLHFLGYMKMASQPRPRNISNGQNQEPKKASLSLFPVIPGERQGF